MAIVEQIRGHVDGALSEATVSDDGVVHNVVLCGPVSRNGYRYTEAALRSGVGKYVGKPVFIDHAPDERRPFARSARDFAGTVVADRFDGGKLRGDVRPLSTESGALFKQLAESQAPGVGMSHVVGGDQDDNGDVIEIHEVVSVDAVAFPATVDSFSEQRNGEMSDASSQLVEQLQSKVDELSEGKRALEEEKQTLSEQVSALTKERDEMQSTLDQTKSELAEAQKSLDEYETKEKLAERQASVTKALKDAGLDPEDEVAVSEAFLNVLNAEADEGKRKSLIEDRKKLVDSGGGGATGTRCSERRSPDGEAFDPSKIAPQFV